MPPEFPQAPGRRGHERARVARRKGTSQGHWAAWRALRLHPACSTPRGRGRGRPAPDSRVPPLQEEPLRCRTREQVGRGLLVPRKPLPALAVLRPWARFCLHILLLPGRPAGSPPHPVSPSSLVHPPPLVPGFSPGKCFPSARASKAASLLSDHEPPTAPPADRTARSELGLPDAACSCPSLAPSPLGSHAGPQAVPPFLALDPQPRTVANYILAQHVAPTPKPLAAPTDPVEQRNSWRPSTKEGPVAVYSFN